MLSIVIIVSFPHLLGLEWQLIYPCLKRSNSEATEAEREGERALPTKIQTLNQLLPCFSEPWPSLCLCRAALCKLSSSLWLLLGASTPKPWRSSSGGITLEAPPPFSCRPGQEVASSHLWQLGDHTCWSSSQAALPRPRPLRLLP